MGFPRRGVVPYLLLLLAARSDGAETGTEDGDTGGNLDTADSADTADTPELAVIEASWLAPLIHVDASPEVL